MRSADSACAEVIQATNPDIVQREDDGVADAAMVEWKTGIGVIGGVMTEKGYGFHVFKGNEGGDQKE